MFEVSIAGERLKSLQQALQQGKPLKAIGDKWELSDLLAIGALAIHQAYASRQLTRESELSGSEEKDAEDNFAEQDIREVHGAIGEIFSKLPQAIAAKPPAGIRFSIDWPEEVDEPTITDL